MKARTVHKLYSDETQEIFAWYRNTPQPYGLQDIIRFNALYGRAYAVMSREEKQRVELLVDKIIKNVEYPKLAKKIFGVV